MDAGTAAAVAALAVAILAMAITLAQAIQQYYITGQLIRICDSVVYGGMPGKGERIWEKSQFRFRVVYSMPQICLRPRLWEVALGDSRAAEDLKPLPDLFAPSSSRNGQRWSSPMDCRGWAVNPGEANWVSFCRAVQHSTGGDLFYELVQGDADRCPGDLPVVPMQVSMRDVATVALMAGMTCSDASFSIKQLAMDGAAGTISTSWHPILGSLLRFTPKNFTQPPGLRMDNGRIDPAWMMRMWDVVTIAGRPYSARERRSSTMPEADSWIKLTREMALTKFRTPHFASRASSPLRCYRRHGRMTPYLMSTVKRNTSSSAWIIAQSSKKLQEEEKASAGDAFVPKSPQDGDWCFISDRSVSKSSSAIDMPAHQHQTSRAETQPWLSRLRIRQRRKSKRQPQSEVLVSRRKAVDKEQGTTPVRHVDVPPKKVSLPIDAANSFTPRASTHTPSLLLRERLTNAYRTMGRDLLDGETLTEYIKEKQKENQQTHVRDRQLLLPSYPGEGADEYVDNDSNSEWSILCKKLKQEQVSSCVQQWHDTVRKRQAVRERRDLDEARHLDEIFAVDEATEKSRLRSSHSTRASSRRGRRDSRRRSYEDVDLQEFYSREYRETARKNHEMSSDSHLKDNSIATPIAAHSSEDNPDMEQKLESKNDSGSQPRIPLHHTSGDSVEQDPSYMERPTSLHPKKKAVKFAVDDYQWADNIERFGTDIDKHESPIKSIERLEETSSPVDRSDTHYNTLTLAIGNGSQASEKHEVQSPQAEGMHGNNSVKPEQKGSLTKPPEKAQKSILKLPRERFPEGPLDRPGVAPRRDSHIPERSRWTKVSRAIINPEALEMANERFEERPDFLIVLRVLSRSEIQNLAEVTQRLREQHYDTMDRLGVDIGQPSRDTHDVPLRGNTEESVPTKSSLAVESLDSRQGTLQAEDSHPIFKPTGNNSASYEGFSQLGIAALQTPGQKDPSDLARESRSSRDPLFKDSFSTSPERISDEKFRKRTSRAHSMSATAIRQNDLASESFSDLTVTQKGTKPKFSEYRSTRRSSPVGSSIDGREVETQRGRHQGQVHFRDVPVFDSHESEQTILPSSPLSNPPSQRARSPQTPSGRSNRPRSRSTQRERGFDSPSEYEQSWDDLHAARPNFLRRRKTPPELLQEERGRHNVRSAMPHAERGTAKLSRSLSDESYWNRIEALRERSRSRGHFANSSNLAGERSDDDPDGDDDDSTSSKRSTRKSSGLKTGSSVNWLWICQSDVIPGYFATPWRDHFDESLCTGAIAVAATALEWFTGDASLEYVDSFPNCEEWIMAGRCTHPSYAINAMGGIIVSGRYRRVRFDALDTPIPPLQLLSNSDDTSSSHTLLRDARSRPTLVQRLSELMALDTWLAFCGRLPEIYDGRNNLLRTTPTLIQKLVDDFTYEFSYVDRTAVEGGHQLMKEMADLLLFELDKLGLEKAEQLFALVALLRAAKMALCVVRGSSTAMLRDILLRDAHVYLV